MIHLLKSNVFKSLAATTFVAGSLLSVGAQNNAARAQNLDLATATVPRAGEIALSSLDVSRAVQLWGRPRKDVAVDGKPLRINGQAFTNGFGTHASSRLFVFLDGKANRFVSFVGLDDGEKQGSVEFKVTGDGVTLWSSGVMRQGEAAKPLSVDVAGVRYLTLEVTDGGDGIGGDHADWADARFEGVRGRINVVERLPQQQNQIVPGAAWRDTHNNLIQAHGGGILYYQGKYYWYGEDRSEGYVGIGTSAYVSQDLVNWKPLGVVLPKSSYDEKWKELTINERPKVIYNPRTKKFVMWFHWDRASYWDSRAGVAIADKPEGPFRFLGQIRPIEKSTYRDMNLFVDDDGTAYSIYSGEDNATTHIVRLNADWTAPEMPMVEGKTWVRAMPGQWREAAAPFKYNGKYYLITSGTSGWDPNAASYAVADSMLGEWKIMGNPFVGTGADTTFGSQSTYVMPVPNQPGRFIYMGDRWYPWNLLDARYVWLPFQMKPDGTFEIRYRDSWTPQDVGLPAPRLTATTPLWGTPNIAPAMPADFGDQPLSYDLGGSPELWPLDKRRDVVAAMDAAVRLYNRTGEFPRKVTAIYSPNIPVTVGGSDGTLRFSQPISAGVAIRELGRALGVGTNEKWDSLVKDGRWTGASAIAQLRQFDGPNAVLRVDGGNFSPYGLNSEREFTLQQESRYVQMVTALRRDMGLVAQPIVGMVGVGTWATQAEFKDIRVTKGDQTLYASDFSKGLDGWKTLRGQWEIVDGALRQTSNQTDTRAIIGDPTWSDYTLTLQARKLSGDEGFLVAFGMPTEDTKSFWNLGGWGNTKTGLEMPELPLAQVPGKIETGRWYQIKIEVQGPTVKAYLDGKLVQQARR